MIRSINGIAVTCNLCANSGPIVRYDANRYRAVGAGLANPNEFYIAQINQSAEKEALLDGFVILGADQEEAQAQDGDVAIDFQNYGVPRVKKHICARCLDELKNSTIEFKKVK